MARRRKFQGVLNILSFNRHFYYAGALTLVLTGAGHFIIQWPSWITIALIAALLYGLLIPLVVSAYVYDFSGYYDMKWLDSIHPSGKQPNLMLNIHAGFDETSYLLKEKFPDAELRVFDFYNPVHHTEAAIRRARTVSSVYPDTQSISTSHIPLQDGRADIIFLLSAAHEIRSFEEKVVFLSACKRVCGSSGKVILVEHLRDLPNFLAFSIGFTHFFSRHTWQKAFLKAGFLPEAEQKFTPFMSVFSFSNQ